MIWQIFLIIGLLFFLYLLIFRYGAPWAPIKKSDLSRLDSLLEIKPGEVFYELGCGDGRVLFHLARKNKEARFVGVEISIFFFLYCYLKKISGGYKNVQMRLNDIMRLDLSDADYIYIFMLKKAVEKLAQKVAIEFDREVGFISCCFPVDNWEKYLQQKNCQNGSMPIYYYLYRK